MKEIAQIRVYIDQTYEIKGGHLEVHMILFHGEAQGDYFTGEILPGAVDTQKYGADEALLSARYMIEGEDNTGKPCHVFIENNGVDGKLTPQIITDSEALHWLETKHLQATLEVTEKYVLITILCEGGQL